MPDADNKETLNPIEEIKKEYLEKIDYFGNRVDKYYLYKNAEKKEGISCIVTFGDAFGFKMGTFIYNLKTAMPSIEFKENEITDGSIFFADYLTSGTVLTAELQGVTVMFIFQENELYATAMYKTDSWK